MCILEREGIGRWAIHCECFATIRATDAIEVHYQHQDHVVAEHLAEISGAERDG